MHRRGFLTGAVALAAAARFATQGAERASAEEGTPFDRNWLIEEARRRAGAEFQAAKPSMPEGFGDLSHDQYRDFRFRESARIWRDAGLRQMLDLSPAGYVFNAPVDIHLVENGRARRLRPPAEAFETGPSLPPLPPAVSPPLSGFGAWSEIDRPGDWDEYLTFQGASYFRALGRGQVFGLSARGLAIDVGEASGEEFPLFTAFWIETPSAADDFIVVHALLESASATGAYRFTARPGDETVVDVEATLFARRPVTHLGLAPVTSMFLFDASSRRRFSDYRDAVHNSSGLLMRTGAGEWVWRALANPTELQTSAFLDRGVRGFGLIQRSGGFETFQDLEARYEARPSLWIEPIGDWGEGWVELFEIPAMNEFNDNIVASFRPRLSLTPEAPLSFAYRMRWGSGPARPEGLASVVSTRAGDGADPRSKLFVIDFATPEGFPSDVQPALDVSSGTAREVALRPNPHVGGLRASFQIETPGGGMAELRLRLLSDGRPVSETWLYRLTG